MPDHRTTRGQLSRAGSHSAQITQPSAALRESLILGLVAAVDGSIVLLEPLGSNAPPRAVGLGLAALGLAALALRHRIPASALVLALVSVVAGTELGFPLTGLSAAIALAAVPQHASAATSRIWLAVTLVVALATVVRSSFTQDLAWIDAVATVVVVGIATLGAWSIGAYLQTRRAYLCELEERAAQAERERDQLAQLVVVEEREAVARELHDVVAHTIALMTIQASAARVALPDRPDVAAASIENVELAGRRSMRELQRLVRLLRQPGAREPEPPPASDLGAIEALVDEFRAAGLPVRLESPGWPDGVPTAVALAGLRIVREALTNALKHSEANDVLVRIDEHRGHVRIEVLDDGVGDGSESKPRGHGILGMRERAALVEGMLEAGSAPETGFRVQALLPMALEPAPDRTAR